MSATPADGSRCSGHCCRLFTLPKSPEMLAERARQAREDMARQHRAAEFDIDVVQIASMVIPVATVDAEAAAWWLGHAAQRVGGDVYFYTCKHLQPNGDCGIYALRPSMCREFPYGAPCSFGEVCTSTAARAGRCGSMTSWTRRPAEMWARVEEPWEDRFEVPPSLVVVAEKTDAPRVAEVG